MTLTAEDYREMDQRQYQARMRTANGWNDVWWKARQLLQPVVAQEIKRNLKLQASGIDPGEMASHYQDELAALNAAEELYKKQLRAAASHIDNLRAETERQVDLIEQGIRAVVAAQVTARYGENTLVACALCENNPQSILNWL